MKPVLVIALLSSGLLPLLMPAPGAAQAMSVEDFIRQVAEDNIADVEASRMAQSTTTVPFSVQQLGHQISNDAMQMNDRLSKLAAARNVPLTNQIPGDDRRALERLSKLQGGAFTREYLRYVLADLERDRALFQVATGLFDVGVAQFAKDTLPAIEQELQVARAVYDSQVASVPER